MYYGALVWRQEIYSTIVSNPASASAYPMGVTHSERSGTKKYVQWSAAPAADGGYPTPTGCGALQPMSPLQIVPPTKPLPRIICWNLIPDSLDQVESQIDSNTIYYFEFQTWNLALQPA